MKTTLVLNPHGGSVGGSGDLLLRRASDLSWTLVPVSPQSAREAARAAATDGAELVIAGGGDGTVSAVAQGIHGTGAALGVLPLGTGNDVARTLNMPLDVGLAVEVLAAADRSTLRAMDVLEIETDRRFQVAINSVNGGAAVTIRENMDPELKAALGPLAFVWAAVGSLGQLDRYPVTFQLDQHPEEALEVVSLIVANGGLVGGGLKVAPSARFDDGQLDLVTVRGDATVPQLTLAALRARFGDIEASTFVKHTQGTHLELRHVPPGLSFTVDGELLEGTLRSVRLLPAAMKVVVGPPPDDVEP